MKNKIYASVSFSGVELKGMIKLVEDKLSVLNTFSRDRNRQLLLIQTLEKLKVLLKEIN